jgi:hypothetical protein
MAQCSLETFPCEVDQCVEKVDGLRSSYKSSAEVWLVHFKRGAEYRGTALHQAYLKIFVSVLNKEQGSRDQRALDYELRFYNEIVRPLVEQNICPNFVRPLACSRKCSFRNIERLLHATNLNERARLTLNLEVNLKRITTGNANVDTYSVSDLATERQPGDLPSAAERDRLTRQMYGLLFTEAIADIASLEEMIMRGVSENVFWQILFQVCAACYALDCSKAVHSDLHFRNVLAKADDSRVVVRYTIERNVVTFERQVQVFLFDFDQSYAVQLGDSPKELNITEIPQYNMGKNPRAANSIIPNYSLSIFLCWFVRYLGKFGLEFPRYLDFRRELCQIFQVDEKLVSKKSNRPVTWCGKTGDEQWCQLTPILSKSLPQFYLPQIIQRLVKSPQVPAREYHCEALMFDEMGRLRYSQAGFQV